MRVISDGCIYESGVHESPDAVDRCVPTQAKSTTDLLDTHRILVTNERENHEVAKLYVIILDYTRQRVVRLAETRKCLLSNGWS